MPTRHIKNSPVKVTGTAPDGQEFESFLEEDFFVLLRFNPEVSSFDAQPVTITWTNAQGVSYPYTPDALIHFASKPDGSREPSVLCEVKPDLDRDPDRPIAAVPRTESAEDNKLKWEAAALHAARRGWAWRVFRESDIRTEYLRNAKFLLRYRERQGSGFGGSAILEALRTNGPTPMGQLMAQLFPDPAARAQAFPTCYGLIANRQVRADLERLLTLSTELSAAS